MRPFSVGGPGTTAANTDNGVHLLRAAVVGVPDLGLLAVAEFGVAVHRLALVPRLGAEFAAVVAALLDGFDVVAVAPPTSTPPAVARTLNGGYPHEPVATTEDAGGLRGRPRRCWW